MLSAIRKWVISQMVKSDPSGVVKTLPKQDLIEYSIVNEAEARFSPVLEFVSLTEFCFGKAK